MGNTFEIERKFLISTMELGYYSLIEESVIKQAYLCTDNNEVRITRRLNYNNVVDESLITIKNGQGLVRHEVETPIIPNQFNQLLDIIGIEPIKKLYRVYKMFDGHLLQISKVDDKFIYAEVEFNSIEEATNWRPDEYLNALIIKEVTYDENYKMKNYWRKTRLGLGV